MLERGDLTTWIRRMREERNLMQESDAGRRRSLTRESETGARGLLFPLLSGRHLAGIAALLGRYPAGIPLPVALLLG